MIQCTVLVTGSRDWTDGDAVEAALRAEETAAGWAHHHGTVMVLVHGSCPFRTFPDGRIASADLYAANRARRLGWRVPGRTDRDDGWPALWDLHGKAAGPLRNQEMVDWVIAQPGRRVCIGFPLPGGKGTQDCLRRARAAGIDTWTVRDGTTAGPHEK